MSEARISQQYVELLAQNPSVARVTQQYVEILSGNTGAATYEENASDTCNFSDEAVFNLNRFLEVSSNVGITDDALNPEDLTVIVPDSLGLSHEATWGNEIELSVSSVLEFEDTSKGDQFATASSTISLTSQVISYFVREGWFLVDYLGLSDEVEFLIRLRPYVNDPFTLTENVVTEQPHYRTIGQLMSLGHSVSVSYGVRNMAVEDDLNLYSYIPFTPSVTDTLNLSDVAERRWWPIDTINFVETALGAKWKEVEEGELDLTSTAEMTGIFTRDTSHDLSLASSVSYYNDDITCVLRNYQPFNGEGSLIPDTLPEQKRDATTNRVTLSWPNTEYPDEQVILRAPEIDDIQRRHITRTYQESLGGRIYVYQNPNWPKYDSVIVTFVALPYETAIEYQDFVYKTLGSEIELGDWDGNIWRGIIVNPEEPIVCDSKAGYTISFQFEGIKQTQHLLTHTVNVTDSTDFELIYGLFDTVTLSDSVAMNGDYTREVTTNTGLSDVSTGGTS